MRRPSTTVLLVFAVVVLVGGSNFVAVRFSNRELPPFFGAAVRFIGASLVLLVLTRALRLPLARGRALGGVLAFGAVNFGLTYACTYWALQTAPAALAATFAALAPLLTFAGAVALGDERFRWGGLAGGLVALAGVGVIFADQLRAVPLAVLGALALQAIGIAVGTIWAKRLPRAHPVATNAVAMLPGALVLFVLALLGGERLAPPRLAATWLALGYLVLSSGVLFVGLFYVIRRWTASAASYGTVLFPVVALVVGAILAGEGVSGTFVAGTLLVMAGVYLGALRPA